MKKFVSYIRNELYLLKEAFIKNTLALLLLPLVLSIFMSYNFMDLYQPEYGLEAIKVKIVNEDEGEYGKQLKDFLTSEALEELIVISDRPTFTIVIGKEYSKELEKNHLRIVGEGNASKTSGELLREVLQQYQKGILKEGKLLEMSQDNYPILMEDLTQEISKFSEDLYQKQQYSTQETLTSKQYQSISSLFIIVFTLSISSVQLSAREEFAGLKKRMSCIPLSAIQRTVFNQIVYFIMLIFYGALYILIWKIYDPTSFSHNPLIYLLWMGIINILILALANIAMTLFPEKLALVFPMLAYYAYLFLVWMPLGDILEGSIGELLKRNPLKVILQDPLVQYFKNGNVSDLLGMGGIILLLGLVLTMISAAISHYKEVRA